jgi:DinB superfamily
MTSRPARPRDATVTVVPVTEEGRMEPDPTNRQAIHDELERARSTIHELVARGSAADLQRSSSGTRWTNRQLLYHMLFGYMVVRALLPLVRAFGRLPHAASRPFARVLNATTPGFHVVNYLGSCAGALVFRGPRLDAQADRVITSLHRHLDREPKDSLQRGMHFPVDWDPFFRDWMTVADVYHYATQHFDYHHRQLTL